MKTTKLYYLYAARLPSSQLVLEVIFKNRDNIEEYVKEQEAKLACTAGMQFRYNIVEVLVEQ